MNLSLLLPQNASATLAWARAQIALSLMPARTPALVYATVASPTARRRPDARVIAALLAVALSVGVSSAHAWGPPINNNTHANGQLVDVQMVVDGQSAPLFQRRGQFDRRYFQAFEGANYAIKLHNLTGQRIGVLITVDGLNVVTGEQSGRSNHEAMYVLDPWENASIRGWRTSLSDIRKFVFVDEERSYASRTDQANGDMGWIRVTTFAEVQPRPTWGKVRSFYRGGGGGELDGVAPQPREREDSPRAQNSEPQSAAPEGTADRRELSSKKSMAGNESAPGTGWGQQSNDPVSRTEFNAQPGATDQIVLRYEYASGLRALGIFPDRNRTWERENGQMGFAKPPRW